MVGEIKIFIKLKEEKRLFFFQKQIYKKPPLKAYMQGCEATYLIII